MMMAEAASPRRRLRFARIIRWPSNIAMTVLSSVLTPLVVPVAAVAIAVVAQAHGWGIFNQVTLPGWVGATLAVMLLDLAIYAQHRLFHAVPWLWRFHRMHHSDPDFDVTTALRFHPVEIWLSALVKLAAVGVIGASPLAVLIFEVVLNATAMFNHSNTALPRSLDRALRLVLVTPDMHRVHHSVLARETNSNFGFNLPWWDRLFGTYRAQPEAGHDGMAIGLGTFDAAHDQRLDRLLIQPVR
ncbi:MAG: sterol desaturase [Sphingomonas sp.]|nr:sterol desaturase [Sphingomonas sp.]